MKVYVLDTGVVTSHEQFRGTLATHIGGRGDQDPSPYFRHLNYRVPMVGRHQTYTWIFYANVYL